MKEKEYNIKAKNIAITKDKKPTSIETNPFFIPHICTNYK